VSDIDTALMDSLKVLDPDGPIREADSTRTSRHVRKVPLSDIAMAACLAKDFNKKAPDDAGAFELLWFSRDQYFATTGPPQLKR
jgi:hypothetical protein